VARFLWLTVDICIIIVVVVIIVIINLGSMDRSLYTVVTIAREPTTSAVISNPFSFRRSLSCPAFGFDFPKQFLHTRLTSNAPVRLTLTLPSPWPPITSSLLHSRLNTHVLHKPLSVDAGPSLRGDGTRRVWESSKDTTPVLWRCESYRADLCKQGSR